MPVAGWPTCLRRFWFGCLCALLWGGLSLTAHPQQVELVVQTGHNFTLAALAYSPDGRLLASGGMDKTVQLWEVATGRLLRILPGHADDITALAFAPDGRRLVSAGKSDTTVRVWDVATGAQVLTLTHHPRPAATEFRVYIQAVAWSPDGNLLASAASGLDANSIKLWDAHSGRELQVWPTRTSIDALAFAPDGRHLVSAGRGNALTLWAVADGQVVRQFAVGNAQEITSVAFAPDGQTIASANHDNTITLWRTATGQVLRTLTGHTAPVAAVAFAPDGKLLASASWDKTVKLWQAATGREVKTLREYPTLLSAVAYAPDGTTVAAVGSNNTIQLWDVPTGRARTPIRGHAFAATVAAFAPDGRQLVSSGGGGTVRLWDTAPGSGVKALRGFTEYVEGVAFAPDGKSVAAVSRFDGKTILWDAASGRQVWNFAKDEGRASYVAFAPDGSLVASASGKTIKLRAPATGAVVRVLTDDSLYGVDEMHFAPDGKVLATKGPLSRAITFWDVATGAKLRTLDSIYPVNLTTMALAPDGQQLAVAGFDDQVLLYGPAGVRSLTGHTGFVRTIAYAPDGQTIATASQDKTIKLWAAATGTELRTLRGHLGEVMSVAWSPDGRKLVSASLDGQVKIWAADSGQELVSLLAVGESDWLVVTPAGFFDGSPAAWDQILWRFGGNTYNYAPAEAFFNEFYYPDLLADVLAGKAPVPPAGRDLAQIDRRQPVVTLTHAPPARAADNDAPAAARMLTLTVTVTDSTQPPAQAGHAPTGGAQDVRLFRNGSLVKLWRGDVLQGRAQTTLSVTVPLVAGANNFTAYAFNRANVKSPDAHLVVVGADTLKRKGTVYILAIGVNEYANQQYNLKYAVADANFYAAEVKSQQERLANYARVEVVTLLNERATKAGILAALAALAATVQPEDGVFIYFAGHGTAHENRFYLLPHDLGYTGPRTALTATGLQTILTHSISDRELEQAFERLDCGHLLLVIDACNSGQALEAEERRRGPMNSRGLAQLAYEKGMYILTAAQSFQAAQEASELGHGLLTYALVEEGLKQGAADEGPPDGAVLVREWLDYATSRVPRMQLKQMQAAQTAGRDLSFAEAERGLDLPQRAGQRPRAFYRREVDAAPLLVARP